MKPFLILILFICFTSIVFGQPEVQANGFTDRTEAQNLTVNGLKEGKWIECTDANGGAMSSANLNSVANKSVYYSLTIYNAGKPIGVSRKYKILRGMLGVATKYRLTGRLYSETFYTDGLPIRTKYYDESGNEIPHPF
ncbi:MAG TPA: hypothetical protein VK890_00960 [Bacteroidia bacterium]|jgi:hypothetical protein|nr:hypothetical protein [Bacteroidia bacterium]